MGKILDYYLNLYESKSKNPQNFPLFSSSLGFYRNPTIIFDPKSKPQTQSKTPKSKKPRSKFDSDKYLKKLKNNFNREIKNLPNYNNNNNNNNNKR